MRTAVICAMALACAPQAARAAVNFLDSPDIVLAISPEIADARTPLSVTLSSRSCTLVAMFPVRREGSDIEVRVQVSDYCDPTLPPIWRSEPIGMLPAGDYLVRYLACPGNALPPGSCSEDAREIFTVAAARRQAIPASGPATLALLGLLLLAATHIPRRR